ncbi:MAG: hypothetical protein U9R08_00535 [Nanoarchaeota archaeon]|nr:hypothetical protein [Nanoarchaeota archaeon]
MAEIPSLLLIIIGILVAGVSYYVGDNFKLFFYIGIIFFVYGLVKWLIVRGRQRPEKVEVKKRYYQNPQKYAQQPQTKKYDYCKSCGCVVHSGDNFCYKCGGKLR